MKKIFAPFFQKANFTSNDCSPKSAEERKDYNRSLINDARFIDIECQSIRCTPDNLEVQSNTADLLMIPNLVHQVAYQSGLFTEAFRVTKPGGRLFVFEPILRELHQESDDFLRYTPYGMIQSLETVGFKILDKKRPVVHSRQSHIVGTKPCNIYQRKNVSVGQISLNSILRISNHLNQNTHKT